MDIAVIIIAVAQAGRVGRDRDHQEKVKSLPRRPGDAKKRELVSSFLLAGGEQFLRRKLWPKIIKVTPLCSNIS